jgi:tripartite-type tricarboxylate transporter receptor subunit TctC
MTREEFRKMTRLQRAVIGAAAALALLPATAVAQSYPTKPMRLVVPFPPGGSNDVVGRVFATKLSEILGKQMIVENRAGAGGTIGTAAVASAPPDGYMLLVVSLAHSVNPGLYNLKYDPVKSFQPVAIMGSGPNVLMVHPSVKARSVKELIALAKKEPGKLHVSHAGVGSFQHMGAALFVRMAGIDVVLVPFKGGGPAMIDVVAGHSQISLSSLVQSTGFIKSGKLIPLGVGGNQRTKVLPDVPTIAEAGLPGYDVANWWGIFAPAGTPKPVVDTLHAAVTKAQADPAILKQFDTEGARVIKMGTAEFGEFYKKDLAKWQKLVKEEGLKR